MHKSTAPKLLNRPRAPKAAKHGADAQAKKRGKRRRQTKKARQKERQIKTQSLKPFTAKQHTAKPKCQGRNNSKAAGQ